MSGIVQRCHRHPLGPDSVSHAACRTHGYVHVPSVGILWAVFPPVIHAHSPQACLATVIYFKGLQLYVPISASRAGFHWLDCENTQGFFLYNSSNIARACALPFPCNNATPKRGQAYTTFYVEAGAVLPVLLPIVVRLVRPGDIHSSRRVKTVSPHLVMATWH